MNYNKQYGYKPYKGAAGPSDEQREAFNQLLMKALTDQGIKHTYEECDIYDPDGEMLICITDNPNWSVCYDRWGYYLNTSVWEGEPELDQVSLNEMLKFLMEKLNAA